MTNIVPNYRVFYSGYSGSAALKPTTASEESPQRMSGIVFYQEPISTKFYRRKSLTGDFEYSS